MISRSKKTTGEDETDAPEEHHQKKELNFNDMSKAFPKGGKERQKIKTRDWKSSVAAYNDL